MNQLKSFVKTMLLGGAVVILPVALMIFLLKWIVNLVTDLIQPLTNLILSNSQISELFADSIVLIAILILCFFVGAFVATNIGKWAYAWIDSSFLQKIPGYSLIKETVLQFIGDKESPFSKVALVQIFENDTLVTAFITDKSENGMWTIFMPTGPNPTSGNIYHVKEEFVHSVDISVEDAMRSIIGCGAGASSYVCQFKGINKK